MAARVVAFINYKGGVAKTTTTYHIGCSLVQHFRKKVLLIDIDPQTNLTFLCASIEEWERFRQKNGTIKTMYERFTARKAPDTKRVIWRQPVGAALKQRIAHLDLIPCDIDLIGEDLGGGSVREPSQHWTCFAVSPVSTSGSDRFCGGQSMRWKTTTTTC